MFKSINQANEILRKHLPRGNVPEDLKLVEGCEHAKEMLRQGIELKNMEPRQPVAGRLVKDNTEPATINDID